MNLFADVAAAFMQTFQKLCAHFGNPVTSLPGGMQTWLMTSAWTKVPSTLYSVSFGRTTTLGGQTTVGPETGTEVAKTAENTAASSSPTAAIYGQADPGTGGSSQGAKIGIGVGVGIGATALSILLATAVLWLRKRNQRRAAPEADSQHPDPQLKQPIASETENKKPDLRSSVGFSELEGDAGGMQSPDTRKSVFSELEGDTAHVDVRHSELSELDGGEAVAVAVRREM